MSEILVPPQHREHWLEPQSITETREGETFCESCGEEIPWHNNSCRLLKMAYKNRISQCSFCPEQRRVGDEMYQHTTTQHADELAAMGAKLPATTIARRAAQ